VVSHRQPRPRSPGHNRISVADPDGIVERHREYGGAAESSDFAGKTSPFGSHDFALFSHRTERPLRFHQLSDDLRHPSSPAQRGTSLHPLEVRRKQTRARHDAPSGRRASKSNKPCSISFNCTSRPSSVVPSEVCKTQQSLSTAGSSVTSGTFCGS